MAVKFGKGVAARLDDKTYNILKDMAKKEQRPLSNMVRFLLLKAIETRDKAK